MILFWRNALFHWEFPMTLWIFVFQMKFKNMILRSFLGPKSSPFWAKPKINLNVKTASFGSIQGLPMAASKTSVLVPSKLSKMHFAQGNTLCMSTFTEETRSFCKVAKHFFVFLQWKWPSKCVLLRQNAHSCFWDQNRTHNGPKKN